MVRTPRFLSGVLVVVGTLLPFVSALRGDDWPVKPVKEWTGKFPDDKDLALKEEAPHSGYVTGEKAWAKLWKAWRRDEKLPKVDFEKQLVLVATSACRGNTMFARFSLNDKGDLRGGIGSTLISCPGFVYMIVVIDREGIKTVNGRLLEKD